MKTSDTRQKIVNTASTLFYKNGYNLTGINEIISEAGIAKATLYSHFKSKEDICIAYLQNMNETFLNDIEAFCRSKKKGKNQLLGIFDFLQSFFKEDDFNGCWCIRTVSEIPRENENILSEIQKQKRRFLDLIKSLVQDNLQLSAAKTESCSKHIYLMYESAVAESHLHKSDWPIKSAKNLIKEIL